MLMDEKLLPIYKAALENNPEAIYKIADSYKFGIGVPQSHTIAHTWYEKLLAFENLPFVEYEYCYFIAGAAAYDRNEFKLAYERYNKSLNLFVQKYGVQEGFEKMNTFEFFDTYYHVKLLSDANCG